MASRFFTRDEFNTFFVREITQSFDVYQRMCDGGYEDNQLAVFDIDFISDQREKLERFAVFLEANYDFTIEYIIQKEYWTMHCVGIELPYTKENLMFWAIDLYCKGYEFDCRLAGYGTQANQGERSFPPMGEEMETDYYHMGLTALNKRNFGAAIIHLSVLLLMKPDFAKAWHARGYAKDEIHLWKAARADYDKAIECAPDFADAWIMRAINKDDAGEYESAIGDFNHAIEIEPGNATAWFNRGNTKFNMGDRQGACEDWQQARSLGASYAEDRINSVCKIS